MHDQLVACGSQVHKAHVLHHTATSERARALRDDIDIPKPYGGREGLMEEGGPDAG